MRHKLISVLYIILALGLSLIPQDVRAEGLGVSVRILPGESGSGDIGTTRNLWLAVGQGNTIYREFVVKGSKDFDVKVIPKINQLDYVNGEAVFSPEFSPINDWVKFEEQFPTDFIVRAKKEKRFTMAITPPFDFPDQILEAYLVIRVEPVDKNGNALSRSGGASVPLQAQMATPMWLGVGNPKKYRLNFRIDDVAGVKYDEKKYIRVYGTNKGKSPIAPNGNLQMKSLDFEMPTQGPFPFYTFGVKPDTKFSFDVPVDNKLVKGNWLTYVVLKQGNYIVTKSISKSIKFRTIKKLNQIEDRANDYQFAIGDYTNLILPTLGIGLIVFAYWRTVNSNRRLKRELALVKSSPPDDSV